MKLTRLICLMLAGATPIQPPLGDSCTPRQQRRLQRKQQHRGTRIHRVQRR